MKERDHLEDRLRWGCWIRIDLRKIVWGIYRGCSWFRIGANGGLLMR
jgi:hypothetical protein